MMDRFRSYSRVADNTTSEYPVFSIAVAMALLYISPFITSWIAVVSFAISLYRMVRYDVRVFVTDYCLLMPISALTKAGGGVSLLIYLCLLAGIWFFLRSGVRSDASYVWLILLLNFLIIRMQMNVSRFVLCFGQIFVLCILLPKQDEESAERSIKMFCLSLIVSSTYAFLFRNTSALRGITGAASAGTWSYGVARFSGLFADPNYYMTFLAVGIALLLKLRDSGRIRNTAFWVQSVWLTVFGIMTYSKTFFLMFVLLIGIMVLWQYWNGKYLHAITFTVIAAVVMLLAFTMENSPFAIVLHRFSGANDLGELTTGRTDIYLLYIAEIFSDVGSFFFGKGMGAEGLYRDPHNLYLEITYYTGVIGLILFLGFFGAITAVMRKHPAVKVRQSLIAKYMILAIVMVLFFTLHGMYDLILYANIFLALLSMLITRKEQNDEIAVQTG